ncbi:type I toxin-antitoxin system Fst family toxin [Companilactobacillus mishanensis]|uniref:Type I toxin-antitoxin system Fst family toxin n=1 Tax=Companilactobacillus mishanensis TaxID=2486008 RepID=A0A5P0ZGB4_9LACO|nr:type I toxin-antitoxin system Fst family toxin [Companilactobacillus mishanensis]MQS90219.1 type I toxin-antitoxin system Fst family toxin [Companilactobacillus mishanensis]
MNALLVSILASILAGCFVALFSYWLNNRGK